VISPEEKRRRRIEKHLGQAAERDRLRKPLNELLAACPTCGTAMQRFRGDIDQCPGGPKRGRGFLIGAGVDKGLSDGRWHRVEFARLPNWRGRRELRLYRADETKPLLARLLSAFSDVFQPDGFISTQ